MEAPIVISRPYAFWWKIWAALTPLGLLLAIAVGIDIAKGHPVDWKLVLNAVGCLLAGGFCLWTWTDLETVVDPVARTIRLTRRPLKRAVTEQVWQFDEVQRIHVSGNINYAWLNFQVNGEEVLAGQWPRTGPEKAGIKEILQRIKTALPAPVEIDGDVRKAFELAGI